LELDLIFIPLRKNDFNETSENYNKMLEAGLFNIPVMVIDMFPYNQILKDAENGIVLKNKKDFVSKLEHFLKSKDELKRIGLGANQFVKENFLYSEMTIGIYDDILS
jgi:glycosyltransferase involved in cell wall biosynthesis